MRDARLGINVARMVNEISAGVAEAVAELLREHRTTQVQLSESAAIPRTTLQRRLIDGDFSITELVHIALVFETTPEAIVARARSIVTAAA